MLCTGICLGLWLNANSARAAFANYNSLLIGDRAAGMGGAYTALTGDPAGVSFYNPASLSRMRGTSLSASANVYHKYDIKYGEEEDSLLGAVLRVNRGAFKSIPSASGGLLSFRRFAVGFSIIVPDHHFFSGKVRADSDTVSFLTLADSSLWAGGNFAYNIDQKQSLGLTAYYTSRDYLRSVTDQTLVANASGALLSEEKAFKHNSLVYILGYFYQLDPHWSLGLSARFPSIEIYGQGSYYRTRFESNGGLLAETVSEPDIKSETRIPSKVNLGLAFTQTQRLILSLDLQYYGPETYLDLDHALGGDLIIHQPVLNGAVGVEWYYRPYLRIRAGAFSNLSSHPKINLDLAQRQGDHIDMWGFSANIAFFSSESASFSFGGYFSGGSGSSTQIFKQKIVEVAKEYRVFSMLISSAYYF